MNNKVLFGIATLAIVLLAMCAAATTNHPDYKWGWSRINNNTYSFEVVLNETTPSEELMSLLGGRQLDLTVITNAPDKDGNWFTTATRVTGHGYRVSDGIDIQMNGKINSSFALEDGDLKDVIIKPRRINFTYSR